MHQLSQQQLARLPTTRPATHEVSHAVVIVLELGGAVSVLAAFTLSQLRLLDQHSVVYLILNLVGSAVLAVIAFAGPALGLPAPGGRLVDRLGDEPVGVLRRGQEGAGHS